MKVPSNINSCSPGLFHSCKRAGAQLSREQSSTSLGNTWKYVYIRTSFMFPFFFFFFFGLSRAACGGSSTVRAWNEALLVAIVPDAEHPGANVLQLFSPEGVISGHEDDCLCSVGLPAEQHPTAGGEYCLFHQ